MKRLIILLMLVSSVSLYNCDNLFTNPQSSQANLLKNSTFEIDNNPSFAHWQIVSPLFIDFSHDTPDRFCRWSASLSTFDPYREIPIPIVQLFQTVKIPAGRKIYILSFWAKLDSANGGLARIINNNTVKSITINDTIWNNYSLVDTINAASSDSIRVEFWGGYSHNPGGRLLVDVCHLTSG